MGKCVNNDYNVLLIVEVTVIGIHAGDTGKMPCKYGPVFAPYLHDWTLYGINTVQKWVRIYTAFFLCESLSYGIM